MLCGLCGGVDHLRRERWPLRYWWAAPAKQRITTPTPQRLQLLGGVIPAPYPHVGVACSRICHVGRLDAGRLALVRVMAVGPGLAAGAAVFLSGGSRLPRITLHRRRGFRLGVPPCAAALTACVVQRAGGRLSSRRMTGVSCAPDRRYQPSSPADPRAGWDRLRCRTFPSCRGWRGGAGGSVGGVGPASQAGDRGAKFTFRGG